MSNFRTYAYLRASTIEQDETRAKGALIQFADDHDLSISAFFAENESGAKLHRPELFRLLDIAQKGDILISVRAPVGSTNWAKEKCCIGRGLSAIRVKIEPEFVYFFLKSLERKLSKSGTGSVFNSISKNDLFQIQIPVPDTSIQKQIVQNIKNAEKKFKMQKRQFENIKNNYESKINYINHIQSSVLDSAFSGKLLK